MALARWQRSIVDDQGNILANASITVRRESDGALATLYTDRAGTIAAGNPVYSDADGFAYFHVVGDAYRIDVASGSYSQTLRYVAVGLAAESDSVIVGISYILSSSTSAAVPGDGYMRFNNATPSSATYIYLDDQDRAGVDVGTLMTAINSMGKSGDRGLICVRDGTHEMIARISGDTVDSGGYWRIPITVLVASDFAASSEYSLTVMGRGADGAAGGGNVYTPTGSPTKTGNIAYFADDVTVDMVDVLASDLAELILATRVQTVTGNGALSINMALGWHVKLNLTGNVTSFTVTNEPANGRLGKLTLDISNSGAYDILTWPSGTMWALPGSPNEPTQTHSGKDTVILTTTDNGTSWRGYLAAQGLA